MRFSLAYSATWIWAWSRSVLEGTKVMVFTEYNEVKEEQRRIYEKE